MAMAMTVTLLAPTCTANAASKNHAGEVKVDFKAEADSGDDSNFILGAGFSATFGKKYEVSFKLYVPTGFITKEGAYIYPIPSLGLNSEDGVTSLGMVSQSGDSTDYTIENSAVTKFGDFYCVNVSSTLDNFTYYDEATETEKEIEAPAGNGSVIMSIFVPCFGADYKGSVYVDDIEVKADDQTVFSEDFENAYEIIYKNQSMDGFDTVNKVAFSGKALEVAKSALTVKTGKSVKAKATAYPAGKITYKSSNTKVATVDKKGNIKGVKKGKATITVKANGKTVKIKVTVK